ncbi:MAG: carboxypeptidase regulatory-like domain-containing protein [Bdellovibrionales bacterium]|nr:carboxypeptidase regulatory-like domain-containing protein [Bdellovibrionales bacterium]
MKQILLFTNIFICVFLINSLKTYAAKSYNWKVLDNFNNPIHGATVIVYNSKKTINKKLISDSNGNVAKDIPASISAPWTLIVSYPNFITKTVLEIKKENNLNIYLTKQATNINTLSGKTSNFSNIRRDGLIDFGLTLYSLNLSEIWNIAADNFFSTKILPVPTFSRVKVPANVSLPNQTESYFLSIRLKKEYYELVVPKNKKYIIHTLHGQFPLKKAIKKIQGGNSFISLVNLFKFKAYSSKNSDFVKTEDKKLDFDLSKKTIGGSIQVKANIDTKLQEVLLLSLDKKQNQYLPFDIKRLSSSGSALSIPKDSLNKNVLGLLTEKNKLKLTSKNLSDFPESSQIQNFTDEEFKMLQIFELNSDKTTNKKYMQEWEDFLPKDSLAATKSQFLTAKKISIALQKTSDNKVNLNFLPLIAAPKINNNYVDLKLPTIANNFKAHSSLLQLVEIKEVFIDKNKKHKILTTKILSEVAVSTWVSKFNIDFVNNFKKDPSKRYAIQIIFLATTGQSSEPSHATRSLQELL